MSEMSYLEKLLDGVEVEWKTLGSIAELKRGTSITKKDVIDGTIPVVAGGRTPAYYHNTSNRDGQTIVIAGSGAYAGFVSWWEEPIFVSDAFTVKPHNILLPRYCYHFLMNMQQQLHEFKSGGGVPHVYPRDVSPILIPIPCPDTPEKSLAIQSEIVRILDKFTALTAELTAELNMRKKQYNYYRDQLFSFNTEDVPHLPMGQKDIGEFIRGGTFQKKDFIDAGVGCIHYGQIYTYYGTYTEKTKTYISTALAKKCKKAQKGDLIIATTSENDEDVCKAVAWLGSEDIAVSSDACIYKHNLNPKYVSYFFQTEQFQNQKRQYITGAKVRRVNADNLSKILIPVPSMEIQERIVSILDKFDTLTNSITEGLPREIELRQKQYEYYRDLLFSFPKPETVSN
ncbi:restriction endonuclease subunit S [Escherichia coli]|uniref:restriction endonuclease subunit S n=1 Tax=Escherichia coli TaxID=562 RepID=UPI0027E18B00|nr:restriction endonuclease subunit S [Escherichia coli]